MMEPSWIAGLIGGLMIGCAAAGFLLLNGRVMGASGLLSGIVDGTGRANLGERLAFVTGLIGVPAFLTLGGGANTNITGNLLIVAVAGLAVGLGTSVANGCTSGHGVCGISRFSLRGTAATLAFVGAGVVTLAVARHALGVV